MSRYLPSFLKRAAAPSETTPLVQQDDTAAEEGNIRADRDGKEDEKEDETPPEQGDIHAFGDFVRTRQAVTIIPGAGLALQLCLGVLILLAAAFVIWTIITLCTTSHVLSSPCAEASPIWAYLISALAFLLLEPIFSLAWDGVIGFLEFFHNMFGRADQIQKSDELLWRTKAQFKTWDALAHVLLSIWGLVIWTNLSYKCADFYSQHDFTWLFLQFCIVTVFMCAKTVVVTVYAVWMWIHLASIQTKTRWTD